jgi:SAM-dependent methyltransferase
VDEAFTAHYNLGVEEGRLIPAEGGPSLELVRTLELLERFLPSPPAAILDVGGGPGVYAGILARRGYRVHLIDVLQLHVAQAASTAAAQPEAAFTVALGDARRLDEASESYDVVLLLGPLYHLTKRDDRLAALREACRVLHSRGVVFGAAISRFASLLDGFRQGLLTDPTFATVVERDLRDGQHRNPAGVERPDWFTTSFLHYPNELAEEVGEAGFAVEAVLGVEGPGWLFENWWNDSRRREIVLRSARLIEQDPALQAISGHLLAVGRKL